MQNGLLHVVLISFKEDTPQEKRDDIYNRYQSLAEECGGEGEGILFWRVDRNLDPRKNIHLVEIAVFTGNDSFQKFRQHAKHQELVNILKDIGNWWVGDINSSIEFFAQSAA